MDINELYLKTAFCCMACDGDIAKEEVALLENAVKTSDLFRGLDIQDKLNGFVRDINNEGAVFLSSFLNEVATANLSDEQAIALVNLAINTIEADNNIEYSEVSFFKKIRKRLSVSDDAILAALPDKEDYLLPDIEVPDDSIWNVSFGEIQIAL